MELGGGLEPPGCDAVDLRRRTGQLQRVRRDSFCGTCLRYRSLRGGFRRTQVLAAFQCLIWNKRITRWSSTVAVKHGSHAPGRSTPVGRDGGSRRVVRRVRRGGARDAGTDHRRRGRPRRARPPEPGHGAAAFATADHRGRPRPVLARVRERPSSSATCSRCPVARTLSGLAAAAGSRCTGWSSVDRRLDDRIAYLAVLLLSG